MGSIPRKPGVKVCTYNLRTWEGGAGLEASKVYAAREVSATVGFRPAVAWVL